MDFLQVFAGFALCLLFPFGPTLFRVPLLGCQRSIWLWPRPSVAGSAPTSDAPETWPSRGPAKPVRMHNVVHSRQLRDPAISPHPRSWECSQLPQGLPEGRIPVAPEFMAIFILSKTRGNKPRRRGKNRVS